MKKKGILFIIALMLLINIAAARADFIETNYFFDKASGGNVNQVSGIVYRCADTDCVNVNNVIFSQNSGNSNRLVIPFPDTNNRRYYGEYFYANCYIPKEFLVWSQGSGQVTYNNHLNKAKNCRSPVSLSVVNTGHVNEPIVIGVAADISTTTQSAFRENYQPPFFTPPGFDDHYSAQTSLTIEVRDASNNVVFSRQRNLNLLMDTSETRTFSWTPTAEGSYTVVASTSVTDCQCSSKVDQSASKNTVVLPARPLNKCYSILNNLEPRAQFPVEGDTVTFDVDKISNFMNNNGGKSPLATDITIMVTNATHTILNTVERFPANPNGNQMSVNFDVTFPTRGQHSVALTGTAVNCPAGATDNIEDATAKSIYIDVQPTFAIEFSIVNAVGNVPIQGAQITMNNGFNGATNSNGFLRLPGFVPGTYEYTIVKQGFNILIDDVTVVAADKELNLQLFKSNVASVILPIPNQLQNRNQDITFDLDIYGDDLDDPQPTLTWGASPGANIGVAIDNQNNIIVTPGVDFVGQSNVGVTLTDPHGASDSDNFDVLFVPCISNSACDDGNNRTEDVCVNPGTLSSSCENRAILCFNNPECGTNGLIGTPFCDGTGDSADLFRTHTCNNPGTSQSTCTTSDAPQVIDDCNATEACENGACQAVACFVESDCGTDGFVGVPFCDANGNVTDLFRDHTCNNGGTANSSCTFTDLPVLADDCTDNEVCENSACQTVACFNNGDCDDNNNFTDDTCVGSGTANATCQNTPIACFVDADCGTEGFIGDSFCGTNLTVNKTFLDFQCNNQGTTASFCTNTTDPIVNETCSVGDLCENGACQNVTCFLNSDCGDGNAQTEDICVGPGTVNSTCENRQIQCLNNAQCGTDGLIGQPFCDGSGDSTDLFRVHTCNNSGTNQSFCSSADTPIQLEDCRFNQTCENGGCQNVTCFNNAQCDDGDPLTQDDCIDPGSANSTCINTAIACNVATDCGSDFLFGDPFCNTNLSVNRTLFEFSCNNGGGNTSFCSNATRPTQIQTCSVGDLCENGVCQNVTCFNNAGCDDGNVSTEDVCIGPGTVNSTCENRIIQCFNNTNCGSDGFLGNPFCDTNGNVSDTFRTHSCNNAGTNQSFCSSIDGIQLFDDCANNEVCENAACQTVVCFNNGDCDDGNNLTQDDCINPGAANSTCLYTPIACNVNNDCGSDGLIGDPFCGTNLTVNRTFQSFNCNNAGSNTSFCSNMTQPTQIQTCSVGDLCENGACQTVTCFNNVDCTDGDAQTEDICVAPGTANSTCENRQIQCLNEAQCGTDGLLGNQFCDGNNNVSDTFRDHTCNNAGTNQSFCNFVDTVQVVDGCGTGQVCENAACANVSCFQETDCGSDGFIGSTFCNTDGNVSDTFRDHTCNNAGTANATCSFADTVQQTIDCNATQVCENGACQTVGCFIETDCGIDGFLGNPVCDTDGNVSDTFRDHTCNGGGTANSSCTFTDTSQLFDDCTNNEVCEIGQCNTVNCFSDTDCDDGNAFTQDTCNNPGTGSSFCSFQNILCLKNTDCGTDNLFGSFFCDGNFVVQNFRSFFCINPGLTNATCVAGDSPVQKKLCPNGCLNGACQSAPKPGLKIDRISLRGAGSSRSGGSGGSSGGTSFYFASITVNNDGETNLRNLQMTAYFPEFGVISKSRHFDLTQSGVISRKLYLELPTLEPGLYDVRFTISNDNVRRVRHREIMVE